MDVNNRKFIKDFPDSYLVEGGVNTDFFRPKKLKIAFFDKDNKGSEYIKKELKGLENISLLPMKNLDNVALSETYAQADWFVSWERDGGWSNTCAEAIARGVPVVSNGNNVEPFRDKIIIVKDLKQFFTNPMVEFSWSKVVDKLQSIFEQYVK